MRASPNPTVQAISPSYKEPDVLRRRLQMNFRQFAILVGVDKTTAAYWYKKKASTKGAHAAFMQVLGGRDAQTVRVLQAWARKGGIGYVFEKLFDKITEDDLVI